MASQSSLAKALATTNNHMLLGYVLCCIHVLVLLSSNTAFVEARQLTAAAEGGTFKITSYGGGTGNADNAEAIMKAWTAACAAGGGTVEVPSGIFSTGPVKLEGKNCGGDMSFVLNGDLKCLGKEAWGKNDLETWIQFDNAPKLKILGTGTLNGEGQVKWYPYACKETESKVCNDHAPTGLKLMNCPGATITGIKSLDAPQMHIVLYKCDSCFVNNVKITAPAKSPNTDGIHVSNSNSVTIKNCVIGTGDDCVSVGDETHDLTVEDVACGPGHGISIGSLGNDKTKVVDVSNVTIVGSQFIGTTNGVRIKTWQDGRGTVTAIKALNLNFVNVENCMILDQYYTNGHGDSNKPETSAVKIIDVTYNNLTGTGKPPIIYFNCSPESCKNIALNKVDITAATGPRNIMDKALVHCQNIDGLVNVGSTLNTAGCNSKS